MYGPISATCSAVGAEHLRPGIDSGAFWPVLVPPGVLGQDPGEVAEVAFRPLFLVALARVVPEHLGPGVIDAAVRRRLQDLAG